MKLFSRAPDFVIGKPDAPYLRRWWIIPRNRFFNIYLHQILRSDDDRALHDHPWWNVSIILRGGYREWMPAPLPGAPLSTRWLIRKAGHVVVRRATHAHALELLPDLSQPENKDALIACWSLFITGPKVREWGFLCPQGWRHWRQFIGVPVGEAKGDEIGPGCGEA